MRNSHKCHIDKDKDKENTKARKRQSQDNKEIHSSFNTDNNQSSIPFNELKQSTEWKSNFPDKRTLYFFMEIFQMHLQYRFIIGTKCAVWTSIFKRIHC